ncbi:hypothetical protein [Deinococcus aquiradiocola]|nr:hypothetical protein [Deinococcus aquiradiocola]
MTAQGLVNAPDEAIAITPTPISVASFTDRVRKVRHVEATFQVTNTTAATLSNLYFLPTVTADTDGDPSNNASTPTIAGTPYRALTYFDGSDASAKAASLQATSGETLDPATGEITYTGNIYRSDLDVSGVVPVPPAGLSATVQNAGWRVALALAPGEHTTVTLGVDIEGIDPDSPKSDVYNFRLVFTPVQDDPALTATGSVPDATRIRGRVTDTALYGGRATFGSLYTAPGFDIGAAGEVDYALPAVPAASDFTRVIMPSNYFSFGCSFSGTISDSDAEIAVYDALRTTGVQGDPIGTLQESIVAGGRRSTSRVAHVYAKAPVDIEGNVWCFGNTYYSVHLKAGWNAVEVFGSNVYDLNSGARSVLTAVRNAAGVSASVTDTSTIVLHPGERVTRNVKFLQLGGYSGTVRLSTTVPGVTVEPSTVNLASLGTQGLRAQALSTPLTFVAAADAPDHPYFLSSDALVLKDGNDAPLGQMPLSLQVLTPSVSLSSYGTPLPVNVALGDSGSVTLSLYSVNGLNGPVTVGVSGLPTGVTVPPQTVQVTSSGPTTVTLPLQVAADAMVGASKVTFTFSVPLSQFSYPQAASFTLNVLPKRTALPVNNGVYPAANGLWVRTTSPYSGTQTLTFTRYVNGVAAASFTLDTIQDYRIIWTVLSAPSGDLIAYGGPDGQRLRTYHDDGSMQETVYAESLTAASGPVIDAQGRFWYAQNPAGSLVHTNPDGTVTVVDATRDYRSLTWTVSTDGRRIVASQYTGVAYLIDTAADSVTPVGGNYGRYGAVYANDGTGWFWDYGTLRQALPDGSTRTPVITLPYIDSLIGFDAVQPGVLWAKTSNTVVRIDVNALTSRAVNLGTGFDSTVLNRQGGVDVIFSSPTPATSHLD